MDLIASISKGRSARYTYYHCQRGCKTRFRKEIVENEILFILKNIQLNPTILKLFDEMVSEIFKEQESLQINELKSIENQLEDIDKKLLILYKKRFVDETIPVEQYEILVKDYEKEKSSLLAKKHDIQNFLGQFDNYVKINGNLLSNLPYYYELADNHSKKIILGSIFIEKLIFEKNKFRTANINPLLRKLCRKTTDFGGLKNELAMSNHSQPFRVHPAGLEPAT